MKKNLFFLFIVLAACGSETKEETHGAVSENIYLGQTPVKDTLVITAEEKDTVSKKETLPPDTTFTFTVTQGQKGFGYEIFNGEKLMIRQPHIPAVQGVQEFATREDASRVALIVIEKLGQGITPPSVSIDDLKKAGIVK